MTVDLRNKRPPEGVTTIDTIMSTPFVLRYLKQSHSPTKVETMAKALFGFTDWITDL